MLFLSSDAFGTNASIRIFISDIEYAARSMDAVICAISERGYLADHADAGGGESAWKSDRLG